MHRSWGRRITKGEHSEKHSEVAVEPVCRWSPEKPVKSKQSVSLDHTRPCISTYNKHIKRQVRIHATDNVVRACIFIMLSVLEVAQRVPPTCTTSTSRTPPQQHRSWPARGILGQQYPKRQAKITRGVRGQLVAAANKFRKSQCNRYNRAKSVNNLQKSFRTRKTSYLIAMAWPISVALK